MSDTQTYDSRVNGGTNGHSQGLGSSASGFVGQAPPSVGVLQAARRYPLVVIIPALLLLVIGVAVAMQRTPTYAADARLTVGRINLNAPGALAGYASATQALASQFSRSVTADQVVTPVAKELDIPAARVRKRVSASPIPESPLFTLRATGSSEAGAMALANAAADSVVRYAQEFNDRDPDSQALLGEYKEAVSVLADRQARVDALRRQLDEEPSSERRRRLARAQASRDFWSLRERAVEERYLAASGGEASSRLIAILNPAVSATSDRGRWVQILGFAGLVSGLLLGFALATLIANRTLRRRLSATP